MDTFKIKIKTALVKKTVSFEEMAFPDTHKAETEEPSAKRQKTEDNTEAESAENDIVWENSVFCFSGKLDLTKKEAKAAVLAKGGKVSSAINNKTSHLVCEFSGVKYQDALERNLTIWTNVQFMKALEA